MSLLLDALKRAEQEKLSKHPERSAFGEAPQAAHSPSSLELQPVTPSPASASMGRSDAAAAQTVFSAKTTAQHHPDSRNRSALWAAAGAIGIVVAAAAGYVWYSVKLLTPPPIAAKLRPRPPPAPTPPPASAEPSSASKMEALMQPGATANLQNLPPAPSPAPSPGPAKPAPPREPAMSTEQAAVLALLKDAKTAAPVESPRLSRSADSARIPAEVAAGYDALRGGDYALARRRYAAAVACEPGNLDAQLGLATAEARSGNRGAAAHHYRKALELDPRNPTALAGIVALADASRPEALEAQLRADAARVPQGAALQFTLGNLYVAQSRWREAQAAFFEAHRLEPDNADVLYNLAVSLDHLGQSRLAAEYYSRALEASRGQATQFDPAPVARRLAELRP
jgi:tetratricopeptide (TPR) repeat protein